MSDQRAPRGPSILIRLVHDPLVDRYNLSHLRRFLTGAAPISEEIFQLLGRNFHKHPLGKAMYAHTVGALLPSTEARIIDLNGKVLGVNEPDELLARGPKSSWASSITRKLRLKHLIPTAGYIPVIKGLSTKKVLLTITDRIKEMIKGKGSGPRLM
ncbi:MAG: hypothetical protein Q9208_002921 [Pyrenodesmia sp. 3 TL-2023]